MPDYSYPQWLIPRHSPWEALVAGVGAGAQIAANNQRGRALASEAQHRAFQDEVLHQKFQADTQDLQTLQAWWPTFANAEGEALKTLTVPPLKNPQMWNRITMEVENRKQQAAASDFANALSTLNLADPADQAIAWTKAANLPPQYMGMVGSRIEHAITSKRLADAATETARHNQAIEAKGTVTEQNAAAITKLQGLADAARATGDEQTAVEYEKQAEYIQHRPTNTSSLNQDRLLIEAKIADAEKQINDLKLTSGLKGKALDTAVAPIQSQLTDYRKQLHALGSPAGTTAKKQYFNPETGQLQETPYAPNR